MVFYRSRSRHYPVFACVFVILCVLFMQGCKEGGPRVSNPLKQHADITPSRVITFQQDMKMALWNDPSVLKQGDTFIMYVTGNIDGAWENVVPFRATSKDGKNWQIETNNPLIPLGKSGAFDEKKVETPSVVYYKDKYHMYYTGVGKKGLRGSLAIGYATSNDGIHWTKITRKKPLLAPTGNPNKDWNGYHVAEPGAVVFKDKIYLFFHASGTRKGGVKPPNKSVIGLSISDDGLHFSDPVQVLEQGSVYPVTAPEKYLGYSTPSALAIGGRLHLFYDVIASKPRWEQVAIHHAVSSDGLRWKEDKKPLLHKRDFSWTGDEIRAPSAVLDGNIVRLWFAGHDRGQLQNAGIGYAEFNRSDLE